MSGGTRVRAALGLGSNLGDTSANLAEALARLSATPGIDIVARRHGPQNGRPCRALPLRPPRHVEEPPRLKPG